MNPRIDPTRTYTKLMQIQETHSHEQNMQNIRPVVENFSQANYSWITNGVYSKKTHIRRERENSIKAQNMILLEKLYDILSVSPKTAKTSKASVKKSLNYSIRKKEINRINKTNKKIYKSLAEAKPSINVRKINRWNDSQEKYKRNISYSNRRINTYMPTLTQGDTSLYPDLRIKASSTKSRIRNLSTEAFCSEDFSKFLKAKAKNLESLKDNIYVIGDFE
ncbi:hypothetical protein SteCoe_15211 [Stentor coeruleus]|uniref:Uncharacterized protein n=1 Tax=Stentor coeruleus TaxID=5963 RepID=A0A1R2C453_9CILI|nr:hypothetical protein SteCoe_15211 [Stentor coeruleus]